MQTASVAQFAQFVKAHFFSLWWCGGGGRPATLPEYELYPLDYLGFAASELDQSSEATSKDTLKKYQMNCVAHLRRAVDCQISLFLAAFGLLELANRRNLGFDKRMQFLADCGILDTISLRRLSMLRNEMEHQYTVPEVADLQAYYDLTAAFVAVVQQAIAFTNWRDCEFCVESDLPTDAGITVRFSDNAPEVTVTWGESNPSEFQCTVSADTPEDYTFVFRANYVLYHKRFYGREEHPFRLLFGDAA